MSHFIASSAVILTAKTRIAVYNRNVPQKQNKRHFLENNGVEIKRELQSLFKWDKTRFIALQYNEHASEQANGITY